MACYRRGPLTFKADPEVFSFDNKSLTNMDRWDWAGLAATCLLLLLASPQLCSATPSLWVGNHLQLRPTVPAGMQCTSHPAAAFSHPAPITNQVSRPWQIRTLAYSTNISLRQALMSTLQFCPMTVPCALHLVTFRRASHSRCPTSLAWSQASAPATINSR